MSTKRSKFRPTEAAAPAEDSWWVYVVRCADRSLYTGVARNCETRLVEHNAGRGAKYTRSRLPVELVYAERAADRSTALQRELEIKRLPRQRKIELIGA